MPTFLSGFQIGAGLGERGLERRERRRESELDRSYKERILAGQEALRGLQARESDRKLKVLDFEIEQAKKKAKREEELAEVTQQALAHLKDIDFNAPPEKLSASLLQLTAPLAIRDPQLADNFINFAARHIERSRSPAFGNVAEPVVTPTGELFGYTIQTGPGSRTFRQTPGPPTPTTFERNYSAYERARASGDPDKIRAAQRELGLDRLSEDQRARMNAELKTIDIALTSPLHLMSPEQAIQEKMRIIDTYTAPTPQAQQGVDLKREFEEFKRSKVP